MIDACEESAEEIRLFIREWFYKRRTDNRIPGIPTHLWKLWGMTPFNIPQLCLFSFIDFFLAPSF